MNGDSQLIYNAITEIKVELEAIKTKQEERHTENKQDLSVLFKKIDKFNDLPCQTHGVMIKALFAIFGAGLLSAVIGALVRRAVAG